jgi:ferredoxin--NADP+ reductase
MKGRMGALLEAEIVDRRDVTDDLMIVRLRPGAPYPFVPGQYCTIGVDGVERAYSIASAPHEGVLELVVERVADGALTPRLFRLRSGDRVSLRPRAKGTFTLDRAATTHLMVATVTGIAPFVSMIRTWRHASADGVAPAFRVLHGASFRHELVYADELTAVATRHPVAASYVPTISRPADARNRDWMGATGRVDRLVEPHLESWRVSTQATAVYACGHPAMVADVSERLRARGFRVKEERYWPE